MYQKIMKTGLILLTLLLPASYLPAQSGSPYRLSLENLKPPNLLSGSNPALFSLDSLMYRSQSMMPLSYRLKQMELKYRTSTENEPLSVDFGPMYYLYRPGSDFKTYYDNVEIYYDSYRYLLTYEHGFFAPAYGPIVSRGISKSIYTDLLYPWQNAPHSKFFTYKALYLITNFVYPTHD
jgi:hypothetical protein